MSEPTRTALFTAEYEREMESWLRRRFGWLLGATIGYELLSLLLAIVGLIFYRLARNEDADLLAAHVDSATPLQTAPENGPATLTLSIFATILMLAVAARAFTRVRPRLETREQTLRATNWFILEIGAISFGADLAVRMLFESDGTGLGAAGLSYLLFLHTLPSIFLPWRPRESLRPMYPLFSMFILEMLVLKIAGKIDTVDVIRGLLGAPFMLLPGLAINWWRLRSHRKRFHRRMVTKGFFSFRRELSQARSVQMSLFPKPVQSAELEFDFHYAPANEIGGDFIYTSVDPSGKMSVVLMDVTGHGMASALTVARLSGEIERLFAEDPDISPALVLRALNRYTTLTLAKHGVYLTALALSVDPKSGLIRYVNAGHPPAWVRRADGRVERFDSTTFLLGVIADGSFDADEVEFTLAAHDTLILVTDGVHEATDYRGQQFGLERIADALQKVPPARWSLHLAQTVEKWSGRIGDDDVLVASIRTPTAVRALPHTRSLAEDIEQEMVTPQGAQVTV